MLAMLEPRLSEKTKAVINKLFKIELKGELILKSDSTENISRFNYTKENNINI